jgi:hypothetical protein
MMSKFILSAAATATLVAGLAIAPAPALAQRAKVSEIIVYGTDPCPRSTDDMVYVCARKNESERFRIPEALRPGGALQSRESWAVRARQFETVGATGINSCSPVGPAGYTGCSQQLIRQAFRERREAAKGDAAPIK